MVAKYRGTTVVLYYIIEFANCERNFDWSHKSPVTDLYLLWSFLLIINLEEVRWNNRCSQNRMGRVSKDNRV